VFEIVNTNEQKCVAASMKAVVLAYLNRDFQNLLAARNLESERGIALRQGFTATIDYYYFTDVFFCLQ